MVTLISTGAGVYWSLKGSIGAAPFESMPGERGILSSYKIRVISNSYTFTMF